MAFLGITLLIGALQLIVAQANTQGFEWMTYNPALERIPANSIVAGYDADGVPIYITQMRIEKDKVPGELIPSKAISFAVYNGDIYKSVLTAVPTPILCGSNSAWAFASLGSIPKNAIRCGRTASGDPLYVGRAEINGSIVVGAVGATRSALFVPFNGTQLKWFGTYQILVHAASDVDLWKDATLENFPENAVLASLDRDRRSVYVGIIRVGNQIVPAAVNPDAMIATASYHGGIEESDKFRVLVGKNYQWVPVKKGVIPANAVVAGRTSDGEDMYFGRTAYKREMVSGTILASEKVLYISYFGKLRSIETGFEVLVRVEEES